MPRDGFERCSAVDLHNLGFRQPQSNAPHRRETQKIARRHVLRRRRYARRGNHIIPRAATLLVKGDGMHAIVHRLPPRRPGAAMHETSPVGRPPARALPVVDEFVPPIDTRRDIPPRLTVTKLRQPAPHGFTASVMMVRPAGSFNCGVRFWRGPSRKRPLARYGYGNNNQRENVAQVSHV